MAQYWVILVYYVIHILVGGSLAWELHGNTAQCLILVCICMQCVDTNVCLFILAFTLFVVFLHLFCGRKLVPSIGSLCITSLQGFKTMVCLCYFTIANKLCNLQLSVCD